MANLLIFFAKFFVGYVVARIAVFIVIYGISATLLDYFFDQVWDSLATFGPIAVLQLAGVGDALQIIFSAALLKILYNNYTFAPSALITGGGS